MSARRHSSVNQSPRILAVDPGTRYMGVAFLVGQELIRADVEHVRDPGMGPSEITKKAKVVLSRWIDRYQPNMVVVEQPFFAQSKRSAHLRLVTKAITMLARPTNLSVQFYPPTFVRRIICREGRPTRLGVARVIATDFFPWLQPYYDKEATKSWWRKHYWTSLFDAIAVGLACQVTRRSSNQVKCCLKSNPTP